MRTACQNLKSENKKINSSAVIWWSDASAHYFDVAVPFLFYHKFKSVVQQQPGKSLGYPPYKSKVSIKYEDSLN